MRKITVGWMFPNLLNLHGERGSVQALERVGKQLGLEMDIRRIEDFDDPICFEELDMMIFLPGEIAMFHHLVPALERQRAELDAYLQEGKYLLAIGTTGLLFGKSVLREDGSTVNGLGYFDLTAKERKYVWGDDIHLRVNGLQMELVGSQITMADIDSAEPFGETVYGRGNNGTGTDGAQYKNLIYTNCLGPLFVKNPWFAEHILRDICSKKGIEISGSADHTIARDSFASTLRFIEKKKQ